MSRISDYIRKCPQKVMERIEKALQGSFYILQESGPMAFTLGVGDESGLEFKVKLGQTHSCSCRKHTLEGNLCLHVLWSLVKIFLVEKDSDILFQHSLTEREIEELITKRQQRKQALNYADNSRNDSSSSSKETLVKDDGESFVNPRPISNDEVCPICQDVLLDDSKLTHCKRSCGNSMHVKCLKILINHQKSLHVDSLKCPLCRNDFGSIESVLTDIDSGPKKLVAKPHTHYGMECSARDCRMYPISGNLYKCKTCISGTYLCEKCFLNGEHDEHTFEMKPKPHSKWEAASRAVQPKLPDSVVRSLEQRELTQEDYDMLLTLDSGPQIQGSIPMHVINGFPLIKLTGDADKKRIRLDHDGNCNICVIKIRHGEIVRQIPCGHGFHRECIDRWLINTRSTCPSCGIAAYTAIDGDEQNCIASPNQFKIKEKKKTSKSRKKKREKMDLDTDKFEPFLEIRGSDGISSSTSSLPRLQNSKSKRRLLPPLTRIISQPSQSLEVAQAAESIILQSPSWRPLPQEHPTIFPHQKKETGKLDGKRTFGLPPLATLKLKPTHPPIDLTINSLRIGSNSKSYK